MTFFIYENGQPLDGEFYSTEADVGKALQYAGATAQVYECSLRGPFEKSSIMNVTAVAAQWAWKHADFGAVTDTEHPSNAFSGFIVRHIGERAIDEAYHEERELAS